MYKTIAALAGAFLMMGCAAPSLPVTQKPVSFTRTTAEPAPKVVGLDRVTFRSVQSINGKPIEVAGAVCTATNANLRAQFTTPVAVDLPRTMGKSGPLSLRCTLNGRSITRDLPEVLPVNANVSVGVTTTSAAGLAAGLIVLGLANGIAQERDIWAYSRGGSVYTVKFD